MLGWLLAALSGFLGIGSLGLDAFGADSNVRAQRDANATNLQMNRETNETNIALQEMANTANAQQAELAYQRSLPINQVRDLMSAGVSKSAALNKLTGGGVYSAPVMGAAQTQAGRVNPVMTDLSRVSESLERLGNIPSNAMQYEQRELELKNLQQEYTNRANEERRRQELHDYDIWSRKYGKDNATALDGATNLVLNALLDSGKDISDFKSFDDILRGLNLSNEDSLRNLPSIARSQLESAVRDRFVEARNQRDQINRDNAARDAHDLSVKQREKYEAEIKQLREDYRNSIEEHKTQAKERAVREGVAKVRQILNERNIKTEELRDSFLFDKDGNPTFIGENNVGLKEVWNFLGNMFGVGYLGDILRGLFAVAK